MKEKLKEVLEQFEVCITHFYRGRGAFLCQTEDGIKLLKEYWGSNERLCMEYELKERLKNAGFPRVDQFIKNKEGQFIVYDKYRTPFIMKEYFEGRECNIREEEDIGEGARNLAILHKVLQTIPIDDLDVYEGNSPFLVFEKRNRELQRVKSYIQKKPRKNDFEIAYIACHKIFFEEAQNAWREFREQNYEMVRARYGICHGSYHQHNILISREGVATVNFDKVSKNNQLLDLYLFLRKIMEKNQYRFSYLQTALEAYDKESRLQEQDYIFVYFMFLYPEKFWKISNQYINDKKCWISPKMLEKLLYILRQNEQRKKFLADYKKTFLSKNTLFL